MSCYGRNTKIIDQNRRINIPWDGELDSTEEKVESANDYRKKKFGICNIKSLKGLEEKLAEELAKLNIDYIGRTKTKRRDKSVTKLMNGYWLYWSSIGGDEKARTVVAILVN